MNEIIKNYIGKECIISTFNSQISGTIEALESNWLSVKSGDISQIVNIDYVSRICEHPRNKKGKRKSMVVD